VSTNLFYFGNDHDVTLTPATAGGAALEAATVAWSVVDSAGVEQATGAMAHDGDGTYTGTIESSDIAHLTPGDTYSIVITLTEGGYNGRWSQRRMLTHRPFAG
jgi:hypothetical protein